MENSNVYQVQEIELAYRAPQDMCSRPLLDCAQNAHDFFLDNWSLSSIDLFEEFKVAFLNRQNRLLALYQQSRGGTAFTVVDVKLLMAAALKINAHGLLIAHNHPSGSLIASKADERLTQQIAKAARLLDMRLLDHIIVTSSGFYSFADNGLIGPTGCND